MEQLLLKKCDSAMQPGFGKGEFEGLDVGEWHLSISLAALRF